MDQASFNSPASRLQRVSVLTKMLADIFDFLDLKKNHGKEEQRARDLFYALWISDLFMERVKNNENWSLFCPNEAPGLCDTYGGEFEALYHKYEEEGYVASRIKLSPIQSVVSFPRSITGFEQPANSK